MSVDLGVQLRAIERAKAAFMSDRAVPYTREQQQELQNLEHQTAAILGQLSLMPIDNDATAALCKDAALASLDHHDEEMAVVRQLLENVIRYYKDAPHRKGG